MALTLALAASVAAAPSFVIEKDLFMRDGKPFQILSACIHYSRVRPELWKDRLDRLAAMGANAIETYVPWNYHETTPGDFNFSGMRFGLLVPCVTFTDVSSC